MPAIDCVECRSALPPPPSRGRPRRYCSRRCQARACRRRRDEGPGPSRTAAALPPHDGGSLIDLAITLADRLGLDAVTMRLLADRAGIPAHVLYRQIRNRADLLTAMAERVIAAQRSPSQLDELLHAEWAMYRRHPWLLPVLATNRPPTGPAVLAMIDRVVSALTEAGFDPAEAYRAYLVLSGYTQGMALLLTRDPTGTDYRTWRTATHQRLATTGRLHERPWLLAASRSDPTRDIDTWFDYGLRHLLAGLLPDRPKDMAPVWCGAPKRMLRCECADTDYCR